MRFDANLSWLFRHLPFEERFEAAANAGFEGVEYASPYEYPATSLRTWLDDAGLAQILINSPAGPPGSATRHGSACSPGALTEFRDGFHRALEYAVALDARVIHILGGTCPAGSSRERAFATYLDNLAWATEHAAATNLTLVIEAINQRDAPGFILDSLEQAAEVVTTIGNDQLRILFDVYHCQVSGGDITTRLRALRPLIAHLQVADVPRRAEPGTGEIAWGFIFDQLRRLEYDGWIGCEYHPAGDTLEGLSWLSRELGPGRNPAAIR